MSRHETTPVITATILLIAAVVIKLTLRTSTEAFQTQGTDVGSYGTSVQESSISQGTPVQVSSSISQETAVKQSSISQGTPVQVSSSISQETAVKQSSIQQETAPAGVSAPAESEKSFFQEHSVAIIAGASALTFAALILLTR